MLAVPKRYNLLVKPQNIPYITLILANAYTVLLGVLNHIVEGPPSKWNRFLVEKGVIASVIRRSAGHFRIV
jgi:hypothetical protein